MNLVKPMIKTEPFHFVPVDEWEPATQEERVFNYAKKMIVIPVTKVLQQTDEPVESSLDYFIVQDKKCYNSETTDKSVGFKDHYVKYMNYFVKFYDRDKELLLIYARIKMLIDTYKQDYSKQAFMYDIKKYILSGPIAYYVHQMNMDNYYISLKYRNVENRCLEYSEEHAKVLMEISLFMNIVIPIMMHYVHVNKIVSIKHFILTIFDMIINKYEDEVDVVSKLQETTITNVNRDRSSNSTLWDKQDIRGKNTTTQSLDTVENLIIQIMPKYVYSRNVICYNYSSVIQDIRFKITDISYEFSFVPLYSSRRDEDNNSDFDKFEAHMIAQDESLYIQNKVNCEDTMNRIELIYGPFSEQEINYYMSSLAHDDKQIINPFQQKLIFNLFNRYFGDQVSIMAINKIDYIKLMIASKRLLLNNSMIILPYIISGRIQRLVPRKMVNKREMVKLEQSKFYQAVKEKYRNEKIENDIREIIAHIISSEFVFITPESAEFDGRPIPVISEILCEEVLAFILMV